VTCAEPSLAPEVGSSFPLDPEEVPHEWSGGSGTLLVEAAWFALGWPPGRLRRAFERLPGYDPQAFTDLLSEPPASS